MADKITIKPETLESVANSYEDLSSNLEDASTIVGDNASIEAINTGNAAIKTTSADTKETLDSLDKYLTSVAQAFKDKDTQIAETITDPTPDTLKDVQSTASYKLLMGEKKSVE